MNTTRITATFGGAELTAVIPMNRDAVKQEIDNGRALWGRDDFGTEVIVNVRLANFIELEPEGHH